MRKEYVTPVAKEETFLANSYVAGCAWQITSSSGNNRMQCANPRHDHFMNGEYFTSVWVEATNSTCQIIVTADGIGKTAVVNGNNAQPAKDAMVYGKTGTIYYCTETYKRNSVTYNVPSHVNANRDGGACYGTYVNTGNYEEIKEKVFS